MKARLNPVLTPAGASILRQMIDDDEEIVSEGIVAYIDARRISVRTIYRLLRHCLIRDISEPGAAMIRYIHTPDAQRVLDDPQYEPAIDEAMRTGKPVFR